MDVKCCVEAQPVVKRVTTGNLALRQHYPASSPVAIATICLVTCCLWLEEAPTHFVGFSRSKQDQRVRDIRFLKKELELKLEEIVPEIDALLALNSRVMKALEKNKEALRVTILSKAEQQKRNSLSLRALVESVLGQTSADMQRQLEATTKAFQVNIQKLKSTKGQLEEKLPKVGLSVWFILYLRQKLLHQQRIREDLREAIKENEHFLTLAQSRLALRQQRPGKEQCHDTAQAQLLAEVQQLIAHISK
ncbi:hypothetical protein GOODEAATRI_023559 [Goodea atripinnis]|uniref:Tektin n=1 Tax=Goodea atripinnis TaxID=208336 RepID=A0ABV0MUK5_9TELE